MIHEADRIQKTGPHLRCTENALACVADAGFKCITSANNHFRDYGQNGVLDTLSACRNYNIDYVGVGREIKEAVKVLLKRSEKRE